MTESVPLGVNDLSIPTGTHICAFFRGSAERDDLLLPYLNEGLRAGHKCQCIIDDDVDAVMALGREANIGQPGRRPLEVLSSKQSYLRHGSFSTQEMLNFWNDTVDDALNRDAFSFVRSAGETTWTLKELPTLDDWLNYESELNSFVPRYPQVILCLYDLDHFGSEIVADVLKTHPKVLMGGTVLENLYYLEPDEFLASRR